MSTTTFYLVRHGETMGNRIRRFQTYDTPLSDRGREQAARAGERLAAEGPFHALYSSDLARTMETAQAIGARLGMAPVPHPAFRELDTGDLKGSLYTEVDARTPGFLENWITAGGVTRMPGAAGESSTDVYHRTAAAFDALALRHAGERIAVVSHGWALSLLLAYLHGWDHINHFSKQTVRLENTAVTIIEVDAGNHRRCLLLGCTAHLAGVANPPPAADAAGSV